jgi:hypothetical protein
VLSHWFGRPLIKLRPAMERVSVFFNLSRRVDVSSFGATFQIFEASSVLVSCWEPFKKEVSSFLFEEENTWFIFDKFKNNSVLMLTMVYIVKPTNLSYRE